MISDLCMSCDKTQIITPIKQTKRFNDCHDHIWLSWPFTINTLQMYINVMAISPLKLVNFIPAQQFCNLFFSLNRKRFLNIFDSKWFKAYSIKYLHFSWKQFQVHWIHSLKTGNINIFYPMTLSDFIITFAKRNKTQITIENQMSNSNKIYKCWNYLN